MAFLNFAIYGVTCSFVNLTQRTHVKLYGVIKSIIVIIEGRTHYTLLVFNLNTATIFKSGMRLVS